jgi:predicted MFS family arabinose efflux permease
MIAIPFIINRIYAGDALLLANMTVVFYFGSLVANFGLLRFMPLLRPGRLYLIMQVSRILVLLLIWVQPTLTWLWVAAAYWGFNMGVTTTMSRVMIQEIAEPEFRARLMSVFTLGLMSATPMGSLVLGLVIGQFGELNALIPGMLASAVIFWYGLKHSSIWQYQSPQPTA